ncbi:VOC family protein [Pseudomonas abieticivorans]|uniref:VOC family protein n=1 Tax=Pseudomonas abieticivorans TaxID=2931382 RepID=UPI0020C166D7|nr:VOC family protein [Pseudomonas sp. PIA16]
MTCEHRGVHSIDHYALYVPSLPQAQHFFASFGLEVEASGQHLTLRAADGRVWARILPGEQKSLAYLSFNCYAQDYDALRQQVEHQGARFETGDGVGFWFRDPHGNLLQIKVGDKTMPNGKVTHASISDTAPVRGVGTRDQLPRIQPTRLSHVLFFSPEVPASIDFYQRAIGLRLSDKSQDIIAFLHAPHGCDHHLVAFAKSSAKGWHHAAWEVASIDEVGVGAAQMAKAGYGKGWGTGRHALGSNYFHYVQDPWGSFCEYSAEMDFIAKGTVWPTGDFNPENSLYLWGPDVPENFIFNTEASATPPIP